MLAIQTMVSLNWTKVGLKLNIWGIWLYYLASLNWTKVGLKLSGNLKVANNHDPFKLD